KALVHFANAAEAAMSTYSNREATIYLRQLLALPARGGDDRLRRARWLRMLGSAQNALGLIDVSRASFSQALTLLGEPPPQRRLVLACRTVVEVAKCLAVAGARWLAPEAASQVPRPPRVEEALLGHQGIGYLITDPLGVFYHCIRMLTLAQWPTNASALVRGRATMGLAVGRVRRPRRSATTRARRGRCWSRGITASDKESSPPRGSCWTGRRTSRWGWEI